MATVGQTLVIYLQLTHLLFTYHYAHAGIFHILLLHSVATAIQLATAFQVYFVGIRAHTISVTLTLVTGTATAGNQ